MSGGMNGGGVGYGMKSCYATYHHGGADKRNLADGTSLSTNKMKVENSESTATGSRASLGGESSAASESLTVSCGADGCGAYLLDGTDGACSGSGLDCVSDHTDAEMTRTKSGGAVNSELDNVEVSSAQAMSTCAMGILAFVAQALYRRVL